MPGARRNGTSPFLYVNRIRLKKAEITKRYYGYSIGLSDVQSFLRP